MPIKRSGPNKPSHRDRGRGNSAMPVSRGGMRQRQQDGMLVRGTGAGSHGEVLHVTQISTDGGRTWRPAEPKQGRK